ncbi:hypothetical protein JCM10908_002494 [Rhodotorula pacifica]|uniref:Nem1-Spo7 phosphatase catalytic subunit NEM1 n=1 Tax=Rhodotorula pacifica TaxID=1495444 RepID=UPI00316D1749
MNTIQYFLSTLRPAPPPSARASTSGLRLDSDHLDDLESPASPAHLPLRRAHDYRSGAAQVHRHVGTDAVAEATREGAGARQRAEDDALIAAASLDDDSQSDSSSTDSTGTSLTRGSSRRSGQGLARYDGGQAAGIIIEDPLRDGATVRTEVERGEGIEVDAVVPLDGRPPTRRAAAPIAVSQPARLYDYAAIAAQGVDISTSSVSAEATPTGSTMTTWPWLSRLARWWPFRFTASIFLLARRFLTFFPFPLLTRPGYNALFAPAHYKHQPSPSPPSSQSLSPSISVRRSSTPFATDEEKGMRSAEVVSLTLAGSSSPPLQNLSPTVARSPPRTFGSIAPHGVSTSIPRAPAAPPRLTPKTLVLDLDETLIHSTSRAIGLGGTGGKRGAPKGLKTRVVEVVLDGRSTVYTVYKRPWVDFFLRKVSSWYTIVIFTASLPEYADPVIDWLDGGDGRGGMVGARLFRSDCVARNGSYMKDLTVVEPDLSRVCLVDNSPASYAINQANGIPIEGWINDPTDECLLDLLPMLDSLRFTNDVRRVLGLRGFSKSGGGGDSVTVPTRAKIRPR